MRVSGMNESLMESHHRGWVRRENYTPLPLGVAHSAGLTYELLKGGENTEFNNTDSTKEMKVFLIVRLLGLEMSMHSF